MSSIAHQITVTDSNPPAVEDLRLSVRRSLTTSLKGSFGSAIVRVVDVSPTGFMATHDEWLQLGKSAVTVIAPVADGPSATMSAQTIWGRLVKAEGRISYRSGFVISGDHRAIAEELVEELITRSLVSGHDDSLARKPSREKNQIAAPATAPEDITPMSSAQSFELARRAFGHLRARPQTFDQWRRRARTSREPYADDVLAVWEFLGRGVDLPLVRLACDLG